MCSTNRYNSAWYTPVSWVLCCSASTCSLSSSWTRTRPRPLIQSRKTPDYPEQSLKCSWQWSELMRLQSIHPLSEPEEHFKKTQGCESRSLSTEQGTTWAPNEEHKLLTLYGPSNQTGHTLQSNLFDLNSEYKALCPHFFAPHYVAFTRSSFDMRLWQEDLSQVIKLCCKWTWCPVW